ncbi:uncharacterized protein BXZ73DRAFT_102806 [Epithele typhae]|uniref:uncharacterized protein n=1 Tax=Epithele typhae TaxID=378194 RepID=UPI00200879FE|nr:uncharacterized protein BXZ73DRAFT_102806 [Epithele typhae]KAH9926543.1 hypothetical protein BXZ73DRAFT_102806 [Epithele typhae]
MPAFEGNPTNMERHGVTLPGAQYYPVRLRGTFILVPAFRWKKRLADRSPRATHITDPIARSTCSMPLYAVVSSSHTTEKGTPSIRIRQSSSVAQCAQYPSAPAKQR